LRKGAPIRLSWFTHFGRENVRKISAFFVRLLAEAARLAGANRPLQRHYSLKDGPALGWHFQPAEFGVSKLNFAASENFPLNLHPSWDTMVSQPGRNTEILIQHNTMTGR
jgi:hypothetical protein